MKFQTKTVSLLSISVVLSVGITCYCIYHASKKMLCEYLGIQAKSIAEQVVSTIDTIALEAVIRMTVNMANKTTVLEMPLYQSLRMHLNTCRKAAGIKYLYVVTKNKNNEIIYVVDGFPLTYKGADLSLPGDVEQQYDPALITAFETKQTSIGQLTIDSLWGGKYFSLYSN